MKHRVAELDGALLDAAVAKAEGWEWNGREWAKPPVERHGVMVPQIIRPGHMTDEGGWPVAGQFNPRENWSHGGPIIERERIQLWPDYCYPGGATDQWRALRQGPWSDEQDRMNDTQPLGEGRTPLIAAMRAYVASKLGEVVELP